MDLKALYEKVTASVFSFISKDEAAWRKWVNFEYRRKSDLEKLLGTDVRIEFKERALYLLFTLPDMQFTKNVYWAGEEIDDFYHDLDLNELEKPLLEFAADLVIQFYKIVRQEFADLDEKEELPYERERMMQYYNECILYLMEALPERAEELFPLFVLTVKKLHSDNANCHFSEFPFYRWILNSGVQEKYKELADKQMRDIILCTAFSEKERANALTEYLKVFRNQMNEPHYSLDLLTDQLNFVIDNELIDRGHSYHWSLENLFKIFPGNEHKNLRRRMINFVIASEFELDQSLDPREWPKVILAEAREDPVLAQQIEQLISRRNEENEERRKTDDRIAEENSKRQKAEAAIYANMK